MIVNGVELLNALDVTAGEGRDHVVISNLHELQEVFGYYFSAGAAAERAFMDPKLFGNIVDIATNLPSAQVIRSRMLVVVWALFYAIYWTILKLKNVELCYRIITVFLEFTCN